MSRDSKSVRQSVSFPAHVARRVRSLAKARKTSASKVLVDLVETGLDAKEAERRRFLEMVERLATTRDPEEQERLKTELARLTFGE